MASEGSRYPDRVISATHEALDDEFRAASFYEAVLEKFKGVQPFINIIDAERRHARRLEGLLAAADAPIPKNPYAEGGKSPPPAPPTLGAACEMGVDAEIENAALYDRLMAAVDGYAEVEAAMRDLRRASQENHLPAFRRCSQRRGGAGQSGG